jgi:hypothetical protein
MAFNTAKALGKFNGGFQGQRDSIPIATVAEIDMLSLCLRGNSDPWVLRLLHL